MSHETSSRIKVTSAALLLLANPTCILNIGAQTQEAHFVTPKMTHVKAMTGVSHPEKIVAKPNVATPAGHTQASSARPTSAISTPHASALKPTAREMMARQLRSAPVYPSPAMTPPPAYAYTNAGGSDQPMHVMVGRSVFLNTRARLRKVYVANPTVIDSYTADPNQLIVTAKTPGVSTLVLWDETGESKSYVISSDVSVEDLQAAFNQSPTTKKIKAEGSEGRVILRGTVSSAAALDYALKLAALYSKDVASSLIINPSDVKQVKLQVRIVEVDRSKLTQFGLNFLSALGQVTSSTTTQQFPSTTSVGIPTAGSNGQNYSTITSSDPLNFLLYSTKLNVGITMKDLENKQILQILAEPNIVTLSGEKANFLAGGEFPFPVVQGGAGGLNSITVQFRPYGVKLEFLPFVNDDGTIDLKVAPEVSALDYSNAAVISGYTIPAIATRRADTQVLLRSGQSFAISGLLDRRTTDSLQRTPGIANVPILGQLFRSKSFNHSTNELIVIVTPTVVDPLSDRTTPEDPKPVIPVGVDSTPFDKKYSEKFTER